MSQDPTTWGLAQAAAALRAGRLQAADHVDALLDHCAQHAGLNAYATLDAPALRAAAREADVAHRSGRPLGPLHGVPIALKDNIATRQWPTSAGTAALRHWHPAHDAAIVERLTRAGALIAGKAAMHELAMGWTGQNASFGDTRNPHDPTRMAGGSSGGCAAAIAAHLVPGAIGTDTNGSIRVPSAFCGVVGMRPTQGRYPMTGVLPLAPSLDTLGPMGRCVADLSLLDGVMAGRGEPPSAKREPATLRLGVCRWFWDRLDDEVARRTTHALEQLQRAGVHCVPVEWPALASSVDGSAAAIIGHEVGPALHAYLQTTTEAPGLREVLDALGSDLAGAIEPTASARLAQAYRIAQDRRADLREEWVARFKTHRLDALIHPAARVVAPPLGAQRISPGPDVHTRWGWMPAREAFAQNVTPASLVGAPSIVLPLPAVSAGAPRGTQLPVGLQLDGLPKHDRALLAVAASVEALLSAEKV